MRKFCHFILLVLASLVQGQAPIGAVQHCLYDDEARAIRERALVDELGFVCVRSSFDPWQLAWIKPDSSVEIGRYGKRCLDLAFKHWAGLEVVLSLEISNRLTDAQNDAINAELIAYAYAKGVRSYICLNEPPEWSQGINDPAQRSSLAAKVKRLIALIHKNAPGSRVYGPALHGWYAGATAGEELTRNLARANSLWTTEDWVRSIGRPANIYTATGSTVTKVRAIRPSMVSELARRPGYPFLTRAELNECATQPVDYVFVYCVSNHPGYQLMTPQGTRDEARIRALKP